MPVLPSRKSPPSGITDHTRNAGTNARNGASRNTNRSARSGRRSSLKNSLMPSASVCRIPNGPALFGPTRFCMPAMTLRSNQTMSIVADEPDDEDDDDLDEHDDSGVHSRSPTSSGSMAITVYIRSTRTSMTGGGVDDLADRRARHVERHPQRAARPRARRRRRQHHRAARADDPHLVAGGDAEPVEVERVEVGRARRRPAAPATASSPSRRPGRTACGDHEPIVVADAVGADDRRRGQRSRVGRRHGEHAVARRREGAACTPA